MQSVGCLRASRRWLARHAIIGTHANSPFPSRHVSTNGSQRHNPSEIGQRGSQSKLRRFAPPARTKISQPHQEDVKGKSKAPEIYEKNAGFGKLRMPNGSISLVKVEAYIPTYCANDVSVLLYLIHWLLKQKLPTSNDVSQRLRRYRVNLYRRADIDQRQRDGGVKTWQDDIPSSTDILCAEILLKEVRDECSTEEHIDRLRKVSKQALRGKAYRTLRAVSRLIARKDWKDILKGSKKMQIALLEMQGNNIASQAQQGHWESLWAQRDDIMMMAKEQVKYGILRKDAHSNLQIDIILLKALLSTTTHSSDWRQHGEASSSHGAEHWTFNEAIEWLHQQTMDLYGQINDRWLGNLIIGMTSRLDSDSDMRPSDAEYSKETYEQHLPTYELMLRYFSQSCEQIPENRPDKIVLETMIALESKLMQLCKVWQGTKREMDAAELPSDRHLAHLKQLSAWLVKDTDTNEVDVEGPAEIKRKSCVNDAIFDQLELKARSVHLEICSTSMSQKWRQSISMLDALLDEIKPDEEYHEYVQLKKLESRLKQALCARAMMNTRRLIRGALINVLIQLIGPETPLSLQEKTQGIALLMPLMLKSVRQGMWDPWALRDADIRRNLKHLNVKALIIDPPSELSRFLSKLMGSICPIQAVRRNRVMHGFQLCEEATSASLYWSTMSSLVQVIMKAEGRAAHLVRVGLLPVSNTYPVEKPYARIFTTEGATPARGIWSAFVGIDGKDRNGVILSRMILLLNDLYLPLRLPPSAWKVARLALIQVCSSLSSIDGKRDPLEDQVWSLFNQMEEKAVGMNHVPQEVVEGQELDAARLKLIAKNRKWRETQWKKKRYPEQ